MDLVAEALGMDPIELRRKNAMQVGAMTATGQVLRVQRRAADLSGKGGVEIGDF